MPLCKFCNTEIEWQEVKGQFLPVEPGVIYYSDLKMGQTLLTIGGNSFSYAEGKSYPSIRGRLLHRSECERHIQNELKDF